MYDQVDFKKRELKPFVRVLNHHVSSDEDTQEGFTSSKKVDNEVEDYKSTKVVNRMVKEKSY